MQEFELKAVLWTGGDAPNREVTLTVQPTCGARSMQFCAFWEPGFCGCEDCHPTIGYGATEQEAIADYWENWEEKHGDEIERIREDGYDNSANTR